METLQYLMTGFGVALSTTNLMVAAIGALVGTIVGMLPGLGPINGVAILMPLAFALKLPAETALILLAAVYMGCEFGGRISSILLNVPGDAGAIMTALDGYPMARQGLGGVALSISAWSSFVGSFIATCGIVMFAPLLARWALAFGPAEYFALLCFAFACITGLMGDAPVKAALAAVIGLSLASVGLDSNSGVYRFTGGDVHLSDGIQFIVLVIGLFSISEILLMLEQHHSATGIIKATGRALFNFKELTYTWCPPSAPRWWASWSACCRAPAPPSPAPSPTPPKNGWPARTAGSARATSAAWRRPRRPTTRRRSARSCRC